MRISDWSSDVCSSDLSGAQNAQQKSGLSAPVPAEPARTSEESIMTVAEAEGLARANDIPACRDAGRQLRLAGVAMPSPLLALIALDLQYQQKKAPRSEEHTSELQSLMRISYADFC